MYALLIEHRTLPGKRLEVEATWKAHMQPAIAANSGHMLYAYSFGPDEDSIVAFQIYQSEAASQEFLRLPAYKAYLDASRALLAGEPKVTVLDVRWLKPALQGQ